MPIHSLMWYRGWPPPPESRNADDVFNIAFKYVYLAELKKNRRPIEKIYREKRPDLITNIEDLILFCGDDDNGEKDSQDT